MNKLRRTDLPAELNIIYKERTSPSQVTKPNLQIDLFPNDIWDFLPVLQRNLLIEQLKLQQLFFAYGFKYTDSWTSFPELLKGLIITYLELENPPIVFNNRGVAR